MRSVENQVWTLMRAWPIPDRVDRGDEIVGTTLDVVPDGATRLPLALAFNLIVGGIRARWRMRPPLWRWLSYRVGGRLPSRWHRWMFNDLFGPGWRRRMVANRVIVGLLAFVPAMAILQSLSDYSNGRPPLVILAPLVGSAVGFAVQPLIRGRKERDRKLLRNGYGRLSPWPPPSPVQPSNTGNTGLPSPS